MRRRAESAWRLRWSSMLSCAAARAFGCSLLDGRPNGGGDGVTPTLADVLQEHRHAGLGEASCFLCGLVRTKVCSSFFLSQCAKKKKTSPGSSDPGTQGGGRGRGGRAHLIG